MLHQIWHLYGTVFLHNINNFDIKPVVLTVMWSSVKFSLNLLEEKKLPLSLIWRMKVELSGWIEESTSAVWGSTYLSSSWVTVWSGIKYAKCDPRWRFDDRQLFMTYILCRMLAFALQIPSLCSAQDWENWVGGW